MTAVDTSIAVAVEEEEKEEGDVGSGLSSLNSVTYGVIHDVTNCFAAAGVAPASIASSGVVKFAYGMATP